MESRRARPTIARSGWAGVWIALAALVSGCGTVASWFEPDPFKDYREQQEARWNAQDAAKRDRAARTTEDRVGFADDLRGTGELDRAVWAYLEAYRRDPMNPVPA